MQNTVIAASVLAVFIGMTPLHAQPKGESMTIKGEVVDMWCYLEGGDRGPAKRDCATACAKAGDPIGILDAKGNLYVAAGQHRSRLRENLRAYATLVAGDRH